MTQERVTRKRTTSSEEMARMTPKELLVLWTRMGVIATHVRKSTTRPSPCKGPRGLKRAAKKRRRNELARTLQRNTWRKHFEALKREARS